MANWQDMFMEDLQNAKLPENNEKIGFVENIKKGGWGGVADRATFGVKPMVEAANLYHATKRLQLEDYPRTDDGWQQRQDDKQNIVGYLEEQDELQRRGKTVAAKVGTVVFDMLPFMAEFVATGGLASLGKAGAKKAILNVAGKYAKKGVAKTVAGIGSTMASAGIRTALTPQHIAEKYYENMLPEMGLGEQDKIILGDTEKSPATSIYKAIGDHYIELLSEDSGAGLSKAVKGMATGVMPKGVKASAAKMLNALRKKWIKAVPGRTSMDFAKKLGEKAGFHGMLEEMGEERLGDTLRAIFDVQDFGKKDGNMFDRLVASIPDGEQLLVEAIAFSVPAGVRGGIAAIDGALPATKEQQKTKDFLLSENGAKIFAILQPDKAKEIASKEKPSRKDMDATGVSRWNAEERKTFADMLRKNMPKQDGMTVTDEGISVSGDGLSKTPKEPEQTVTEQPATDETPSVGHHYYDITEKKFVPASESERIEIEGFGDFEFFVSKNDEGWRAYEAKTGMGITNGGLASREDAIKQANEQISKRTPEEIKSLVEKSIELQGISPQYEAAEIQQPVTQAEPETSTDEIQDTEPDIDFSDIEKEALKKGINKKSIIKLRDAIDNKNPDELKKWLHTGNKSLRGIFAEKTSIQLPKTESGTFEAIDNWIESSDTTEKLTYEEFEKKYEQAWELGNKYTPKEAGFNHYSEKMAELADAYPEYLKRFEAEIEESNEKEQKEFTPKDGWRDNLIKAREHAIALGLSTEGKNLEQIVDEIDGLKETEKPLTKEVKENSLPNEKEKKPEPKKKLTDNLSDKDQKRLEQLKQQFKDKMKNQLNSGFDPSMLAMVAEMGSLYVKAGAIKFAKFAKTIIDDIGDDFKPYLKSAYLAARNMPGMEEYKKNMDSADYVDNLNDDDIDNLAKEKDNGEEVSGYGLHGSSGTSEGTVAEEADETTPKGNTGTISGNDSNQSDGNVESDVKGKSTDTIRGDRGDSIQTGDSTGEPEVSGNGNRRPATESGGGKTTGTVRGKAVRVNHHIESDDVIVPGGAITQIKANIKAVKILKTLESEDRQATEEEKKALAQFTGWGNLSQVFHEGNGEAMIAKENGESEYRWRYSYDENWTKKYGKYYKQLKELLTEKEFNAAAASTLNAHYTSRSLIESMWKMAERLGFKGGTILEPGAGIGHFLGLMPKHIAESSKTIAIELDSLTGRMLSKLYPNGKNFITGFEEVDLPPNSVDLVISNYPFASTGPVDANKRYGQDMNLHNYFFARSLDALRPGGILIAITTHYTMDASMQQRKLLASKGELVAALRLPNNAFKENAGTEVTTDIIIMRKPVNDNIGGEDWTRVEDVQTKDGDVATINEYFVNNPEMVLGELSMEGSMYGGKKEFTVLPSKEPLEQSVDEAIRQLPENITSDSITDVDFESIGSTETQKENSLVFDNGKLTVVKDGKRVKVSEVTNSLGTPKAKKQAIAFIKLRDIYQNHLELMLQEEATDEAIVQSQKKLNEVYDGYITKYGYFNTQNNNKFDFDPGYYLVASLETVTNTRDEKTGEKKKIIEKAAVFTQRTIEPVHPPASADTLTDAMNISLCYHGKVDIPYLAKLRNKTIDQIKKELSEKSLAFENPATGLWENAQRYLSGNVRHKLQVAEQAAKSDKRFEKHVKALTAVQPETVGVKDIHFRLGATWIPEEIVQAFARDMLDSRNGKVAYVPALDEWVVTGSTFYGTARNLETFGTARFNGHKILEKALNMRQIRVMDTIETADGKKRVFNQKETLAAEMAVEKMQKEFIKWINQNDQFSEELQEEYNKNYNFHVTPKFDGSHLELPGSSKAFKLRTYQKNVIWRMIQDRCGMIAHCVGSGKTIVMAATAMELRRLGLAKKPVIVVQNATLGQFASQFRAMYPTANILVATPKDLEAKKRKTFMARVASGDYDAVIMAQSSFDLIPNDPERERQYLDDQLRELKEILYDAAQTTGQRSPTVKAIQRRIKALEKKLKTLRDKLAKRQDNVITFEQLGIDTMFIDEAHAYKKPPFITKLSNVKGIDNSPSQKASGLFLKTRHVQEKSNGKGVVLATGTPITNTLGEAWHMLRLATPHLLEEFNITTFDRFVSTFAQILPTIEMNAGQRWVQRQILAKFANGAELGKLIQAGWDVINRDKLAKELEKTGHKLPILKGGKTKSVSVPLSDSVQEFNKFLKGIYQRYENLTGKEKMLMSWLPVVTYNAARAAALDIRLVYPKAQDDPGSKVNVMVNNVVELYKQTKDNKSAQLVFCDSFNHVNMSKLAEFASGANISIDIEESDDIAAEREDMFLYQDMKRKLIAQGVSENEIAIVREFKNTAQREALFEQVNRGEVRVLIGSTSAMGTGVNVQEKLYAIHHLDTPWIPADLEQRQGRLLRYGNENEIVEELAYGMENTLDAAIYAKIVRKAKFIWQVISGEVSAREFEDPAGALILSAEEQMASLAGDPRIFEKIELENSLRQMRMEKEIHAEAIAKSRESKINTKKEIEEITNSVIPQKEKRLAQVEELIDGKSWKLNGKEIEQKDLVKYLQDKIDKRSKEITENTKQSIQEPWNPRGLQPISDKNTILKEKINGIDVLMILGIYKVAADSKDGGLSFDWRIETGTKFSLEDTTLYNSDAATGKGMIMALSNMAKHSKKDLETSQNRLKTLSNNLKEFDSIIESGFENETKLQEGEERLEQLNQEILGEDEDNQNQNIKKPKNETVEDTTEVVKVEKAKTKGGKKLLKALRKDGNKGIRTIVDFVNDVVKTKMIVGKSQTTNRNPAHYSPYGHIVRTKSGIWQLNFHEAGHALSGLLRDTNETLFENTSADFVEFAKRDGSMASSQTAEEGFAEVVRCYVTSSSDLSKTLTGKFEKLVNENNPELLDGLKDARTAYQHFHNKSIIDQMKALQNDKPEKKSLLSSLSELAYSGLYALLGGSTVVHGIMRKTFADIAGDSKLSVFDVTGAIGTVKSILNKAYKSRLKLARKFREEIISTKADVMSAYQTMIHLRQEVQRTLYGIRKGREGIRVYATGKAFDELTVAQIELLEAAGFEIPTESVTHGNWLYLSDKSISKIKHEVGIENWENFCLWGQYKAALERYHNKGHDYPGLYDGLDPVKLQAWINQQATDNPKWNDQFKEIQKYMDQLLLVSVLSGEHSPSQAVKIKIAWEDYWPLPRQIEDKRIKSSGKGVDPDSGVRAAFGSALPFATLDEALETRTRMALEAYYSNRLMWSMIEFSKKVKDNKDIDFETRNNAARIMLPLHLDTKMAAKMKDEEQAAIISEYLNEQLMKETGMTLMELEASGQAVMIEDIEISNPGKKLWRTTKPRAIHVVSVFRGGKRRYYQVTDPILFDMFSRGNNPAKYLSWISKAMIGMVAPWRRALTQNIGFALANSLSRDPANAGFMGKDGYKSLIPYFYAGCGLINRLKGNNINADAVSQSELLSKALDHTTKDAHRGIVGSFKEILKEGIVLTDYRNMSLSNKIAALPGQVMSTLMKPIDIFNWLSGGRWISQTGEELPREGAYVTSAKKGKSAEAAQVDYDYITGDFGGRPGSENVAAIVKAAGFLNPALRIMWGQLSRVTDPDPAARAFNIAAKVPALMMWGSIAAAINYLIIKAINPDDDERKAILEQMRERPDDNRLGYMAIAGKIRLPFDYGIIGAVCSYGWNSTEEWLLEDPIKATKKAKVLLNRARDLPGITDIINPYIKTGAELWLNHSFFYDDDIVPAWMGMAYPLNPELRTWPDIPEVYKKIGQGLKVSPIKVRYAVQNIFTRQMDDAVKVSEKIAGKDPYNETADLPVVGRLVHRKSVGWNSQSVKSLSDLDRQYDSLKAQAKDIENRQGKTRDYWQLQKEIIKLKPTHEAMSQVEKLWKQIKTESAKPNTNRERIDKLKQQMTRKAKIFLKRYQKSA